MNYDYLDEIAREVRAGDNDRVSSLTIVERMYVGLAASSLALLGADSIPYALNRIGTNAREQLISRHRDK